MLGGLAVDRPSEKDSRGSTMPAVPPRALFHVAGPSLVVFSLAATGFVGYVKLGSWKWFSYHPTAMLLAYVAIAGNATLLKKIGGKENTERHGVLMGLATALALFGWYVIYTNKTAFNKPHNTSWHAWMGIAVLVGYMLLAPLSWLTLNPTSGIFRTNKTFRALHKWMGRFLSVLAWLCCAVGWFNMNPDVLVRALFAVPLAVLAPLVFL